MTLCEAQGIRLKAHGGAIIQLKPSWALRLWPSALLRYPLEKNGHGRKQGRFEQESVPANTFERYRDLPIDKL
jgi:hypothetical protein